MGAVAAYTGSLNPTTPARCKSQYQNAMGEWNDGAQTIGASQAIATLHRLTRGRTRVETIALASCRITYTGDVGTDSGASPKLGRFLVFAICASPPRRSRQTRDSLHSGSRRSKASANEPSDALGPGDSLSAPTRRPPFNGKH